MTLTLDLPTDLAQTLTWEADHAGLSLSAYALRILQMRTESVVEKPTTGAELVAYWRNIGVIGMRSDISDTTGYADKLRYAAEHRFEKVES